MEFEEPSGQGKGKQTKIRGAKHGANTETKKRKIGQRRRKLTRIDRYIIEKGGSYYFSNEGTAAEKKRLAKIVLFTIRERELGLQVL